MSIVSIAGVLTAVPQAAEAAAPPAPPTTGFLLRQIGSGLCAAIEYADGGGDTIRSAVLARCTTPGVDRVYYTFANQTSGTSNVALANGICADLYRKNTTNGAPIVGWGCDTSDDAQRFTFVSAGIVNGEQRFVVKVGKSTSTMCLDSEYAHIGLYTPLVQGSCTTNSTTQAWVQVPTLMPVAHWLRQTVGSVPYCAAVDHATAGHIVVMAACDSTPDRNFYLLPSEGNQYRLVLPNHVCLAATGESTTLKVVGATCGTGDGPSQTWTIVKESVSGTRLLNARSTLPNDTCLDGPGSLWSAVLLKTCTGAGSQTWGALIPSDPVQLQNALYNWQCADFPNTDFPLGRIQPCAGTATQMHSVVPVAAGRLWIQLADGRCLIGITSAPTGGGVFAEPCGRTYIDWQSWRVLPNSDGSSSIVQEGGALCMHVWPWDTWRRIYTSTCDYEYGDGFKWRLVA